MVQRACPRLEPRAAKEHDPSHSRLTCREDKMKKLAFILLAAASLVGTAGVASAQGYGGGSNYGGPGPNYGGRDRKRYDDSEDGYYRCDRGHLSPGALRPVEC